MGIRAAWMVAMMLFAGVAFAGPPATQGSACDKSCGGGLACVATGSGHSSCEIPCSGDKACPEEQRCVRDGAARICRPINDSARIPRRPGRPPQR